MTANYQLLRLPLTVLPVFQEWLGRTRPLKAEAVLGQIRSTRDGRLSDSQFGRRMTGQGALADGVRDMFHLFRRKLGYLSSLPPRDCSKFIPPPTASGQLRLF